MERTAEFSVSASGGHATLALTGDWTASALADAPTRLAQALKTDGKATIDIREVRRFDTAGAYAVVRALGYDYDLSKVEARPESARLLELVGAAYKVQPILAPLAGNVQLATQSEVAHEPHAQDSCRTYRGIPRQYRAARARRHHHCRGRSVGERQY